MKLKARINRLHWRHWRATLVQCQHFLKRCWHNGSLFYLFAMLCLLPVWFSPTMPMHSLVQDTLFVIDISESMNVPDVDYPRPHSARLALAKAAVRESMSSLPCGSKVSIALFAGDESVVLFEPLEICQHFPAIDQVVERLETRMRWIGDSWVVRGVVMGMKEAHKRNMNMVMVTDADEMPHHSSPRLNEVLELKEKVKGALLGVGGATPQPVPRLNDRGELVGYWTKEEAVIEGNYPNLLAYVKELPPGESAPAGALDEVIEHLSAFNGAFLKNTAEAAQMQYVHIQHPKDAVAAMANTQLKNVADAEQDARWLFGLLAGAMLILAWFWHTLPFVKRMPYL